MIVYHSEYPGIKTGNFYYPRKPKPFKQTSKQTKKKTIQMRDEAKKMVFQMVFQRDSYKCRLCGSKERISVHHVLRKKYHPSLVNETSNCVTLCFACHGIIHGSNSIFGRTC
jgi:hypothetical protein